MRKRASTKLLKDIVNSYKKESHVRDFWLVEVRHSHMTYISKNKKKVIPRKRKYGGKDD